jgi:hypothetical protein
MAYSVHQLEVAIPMSRRAIFEPFDGIGEGLFVDLGVLGPDAVAD